MVVWIVVVMNPVINWAMYNPEYVFELDYVNQPFRPVQHTNSSFDQ